MATTFRLMVLAVGLAGPALAQQEAPPACGPATRGQVACMAQRMCSCGYVQGGSMTGVASGWAWDCGILRPNCAPPPMPLASQPMPDVFVNPTWPPGARPDPRWPTQPWDPSGGQPGGQSWDPRWGQPGGQPWGQPWGPGTHPGGGPWSDDPPGFDRRPVERPIAPPLPGPAPLTPRPPRL